MLHNVLIWLDLLRHYNRKNASSRCLMKIDLRKAYDMVSWEFLEEALTGFGFPDKFIQWIMICVSTTKFSVKISGERHGYFAGKRGLRCLKTMSNLPDFRFHPMCKSLQLTHLIFADDLMIFCKGNVSSVSRAMEALAHFSAATGLVANMDKSSIFLAGVDDSTRDQLLARTGFTSILKEVDKICRVYMWGRTEEKQKVALVSWERICYPKKQGGLNIKSSRDWNIASVGKLLWQLIMCKESLWVKWVYGIYMKDNINIWEHKPPIDCSWYWKKLNSLKARMQGWYVQGRYHLTERGEYTITRSYLAIVGQEVRLRTTDLIWTSMAQPKHRFLAWLAVQGRLLTKERMLKLHIQVDEVNCCLSAAQVMETTAHLFVE
ncbi:uncharacterized protein LOC132047845 [Lycium ferocissimum]|uniref:uncharacterized protein LOC132047845 n=1 Tax=Lycium ferocissimum TaxID=112874 RepID=UPI002814EB5C|nr:uncharacterized protein LOC132047845 [Lycium ferocissimum]